MSESKGCTKQKTISLQRFANAINLTYWCNGQSSVLSDWGHWQSCKIKKIKTIDRIWSDHEMRLQLVTKSHIRACCGWENPLGPGSLMWLHSVGALDMWRQRQGQWNVALNALVQSASIVALRCSEQHQIHTFTILLRGYSSLERAPQMIVFVV